MKSVFIPLTAISLMIVLGMAMSQNPINSSNVTTADSLNVTPADSLNVTPADALKAIGDSNAEPVLLAGKSFAVFQSPAFKKDGLKGLKSVQTKIDQNVSRNETPGQPTGLRDFILWYDIEIPETEK